VTSSAIRTGALAVLLAVGIGWLIRPEGWKRGGGMALEPGRLALRAGEAAPVELVSRERDVVAVSFRLHFDEDLVAIEGAEPAHASVFDGGQGINLAVRRAAGVVEVPALAVAGGRAFEPGRPLFRFRVKGRRAGSTTVVVEDLRYVDGGDQVETLDVAPLDVAVHGTPDPTP